MLRHLPNLFTCLNLFCGCIAAVMIFRGHPDWAIYLIFIAAFCDLMDGLLARLFHVHSAYGKELDSLADVVSFGFVPALVIFHLLQSAGLEHLFPNEFVRRLMQFFPFVIALFSALRLAKFNLDQRQTSSFIGLPTPANTLFIISLPMILLQYPGRFDWIILSPVFLLILSALSSFLLVCEIPLFSMKFGSLSFRENTFPYILLILGVILVPVFYYAAIPLLIICYLILSVIQNTFPKHQTPAS